MTKNEDSQSEEQSYPKLYNPQTAANWSLLFTPAFGAYLHALNWRELGKHKNAQDNMFWVWTTVIFLIINILLISSEKTTSVMRSISIAMLLIWYYTEARSQVRYVRESLGNNYIKKGFGKPLLIALAAIVVYFAVGFLVIILTLV